MAVTMVIGNRPEIAASLFAPGYTLASAIANEFTETPTDAYLAPFSRLAWSCWGLPCWSMPGAPAPGNLLRPAGSKPNDERPVPLEKAESRKPKAESLPNVKR